MKTEPQLIDVIKEIATCSRMFNEPPQPKPSIRDQFELIEDSIRAVSGELRRLEHRMILLRNQIENVEVGK